MPLLVVIHHHHHRPHSQRGHRIIALPRPRSTACLQRSPIGRVESFRSWLSHLFHVDEVGDARCSQVVTRVIHLCGAEEPCLPVYHCQVEPHAQIPRCVNRIGDGTVKSDRSIVVLHHFKLGHTIRFQTLLAESIQNPHIS